MNNTSLGEKILRFRKRAKFTQLKLEFETEAALGSISRLENNLVNPSKETLYKISYALGLTTYEEADLLGLQLNKTEEYIPEKFRKQKIVGDITLENFIEGNFLEYSLSHGRDYFIRDCDENLNRSCNEVVYIKNVCNWRKVYPEELAIRYHVPKRIKIQKFAKFLLNKSEPSLEFKYEDKLFYRESRIITNNGDFDYTLMIDDYSVTIFLATPNICSFSIKDSEIATKAKNLFNSIWEYS